MAELSIIEFGVYGFITYTSLLMLIISTIKEVPSGKSQSILRSMYLIPGVICAVLLASAGVDIGFDTVTTVNTITDNQTSTIIFTEDITKETKITLQDDVWRTVHIMIFLILLVHVLVQMLSLFTKIE